MLADRALGIVLIAVSSVLFSYSLSFPREAAIYPLAILVLIFLIGLYFSLMPQGTKKFSLRIFLQNIKENKLVSVMILMIMGFIVLIAPLGFYPALFLFLLGGQIILGVRKIQLLLIIALFMTLIVYEIFSVGLRLNI
ncbi:MAG: tripartite tricarboxylate transporter TctB family protein, partial [Treponema sp.]|nr:tripartite tricarboxylate transporter TctB family protein [Treponema sp.]